MSDDFQLSDEERARLERLKRDLLPPSHIEADLIEALRRRGLVRDRSGRWQMLVTVTAALAAGLIAAVLVYRQLDSRAPVNQPESVLLLYAGADGGAWPSRREEYTAWARTVAAQGTTISGLELVEPSEQIAVLPDGPERGVPDQPRGFFVIRARDLDAARQIASSCPHLRYGGRIVLRRAAS